MRFILCLLMAVSCIVASAQAVVPVCDLTDRDTILKVYSNDSNPAVAEGETPGSLALGVIFQPVNDWPSVRFDLPKIQDWSGASVLHVRMLNESKITQTIEVGVQDINGKTYKPGRRIPPGKWTDIRIPIRNMALGTDDGNWCGEAIDITQIKLFWFLVYSPARPVIARFNTIELVKSEKLAASMVSTRGASDGVSLTWNPIAGARVYDIYRRATGEREERLCRFPVARFVDTTAKTGINYRYRVIALDEFLNPGERSRTVAGKVDLQAKPALPELDQYSGRADINLKATGFFRTEQFNGKWVLVTPEGHPMLSVGMCVLGLGDAYTRVSKREHLFTDDIAQKEDPKFAAAWNPPYGYSPYGLEEGKGLVFSPYVRNLILKYGPDWNAKWHAETIKRLDDWHVNTNAAFSGSDFKRPYTPFTAGWGDTPMIPKGDGGFMSVPDVFDPSFEKNIEKSTANIGEMKNDPWIIGWFTANEMGWYGNWEAGMNLIALVHTAPVDLAAKKAWVEFLKGRYTSIIALNESWKTEFADWDALLNNTAKPPRSAGYKDDSSAFLELFADRYFGIISVAIRKQDPNHMILGARHSQGSASEVIRAESKCNEVVSATIYGYRPNNPVRNGSCDTDRPWIAGEFHFQAEDAGLPFRQVEGIYPTQVGRGEAYQDYIADGFGLSNFIGAHWFEYIDEPATGRFDGGKDGGEAHNIGWVNVNDEPYEEFVKRATLINANVPLILK